MPIPKDWPLDDPLPNPYSAFPSVVCEMLTPREIERLRQEAKEPRAYYQKAFAHLRPQAPKSGAED
jgi:hypothetical protein